MKILSQQVKENLLSHLLEFVTDNKKQLFEKIIQHRMKHITVVMEDIYQAHNASAVLRTCDCFGIQDVHIIENKNKYEVNPDVALGSSKWLNLIKHNSKENNTIDTFKKLRKNGYRIVATTPHKNDCLLEDLDINSKFALVFGTELEGLSDIAISSADEYVKIPMYGFTESYNISVSAAIKLQYLTEKLKKSKVDWRLKKNRNYRYKLNWVRQVVKSSEQIERKFLKNL